MKREIIAIAAALLAGSAPAAALDLRRGVGLHEWLNWAPLDAAGGYVQPPYDTIAGWLGRYRPLEDWPSGIELERLRGFGFDFVRLTVDPGPMLATEGADRRRTLAVLEAAVGAVLDAGLDVVFNYHPNDQLDRYAPAAIEGAAGSEPIGRYLAMAAETAAMLAPLGDRVAFEPFNEPAYYPCDSTGTEDWQLILEATVATIRAVAPDLPLVLTGACGGGVEGLIDLDATRLDDPAILYSFHMYEPHDFTHQRLEGGWASGLPWPASAASRAAVEASLTAWMDAAGLSFVDQQLNWLRLGSVVADYYAEGWGEEQLAARFGQALDWAAANGVPADRLFMGEFGVIALTKNGDAGALDADRARYIAAARRLAEGNGIAWSIWEYSNPYGMSFILPDGPPLPDPVLVEALGLPPAQ